MNEDCGKLTPLQYGAAINTSPKQFRVWDRLHKRWFQGATDERSIGLHTDSIYYFGEILVMEGVLFDQNEDSVWKDDPNIKSSLDVMNWLIVVQDTGMLDKTDRHIWEGDVVESDKGNVGVVLYNSRLGRYELRTSTDRLYVDFRGCKVVGSIWETPELVKEPI